LSAVGTSSRPEQGRGEPEAATKRRREVGRLAVADEPRDRRDRDRRLLGQHLRRRRQAPAAQVLVEAQLAELRVRALDLAWRARHGRCHLRERQPAPEVARDDHTRQQIQAPARRERVILHTA
jgi:hypothetical protein